MALPEFFEDMKRVEKQTLSRKIRNIVFFNSGVVTAFKKNRSITCRAGRGQLF